jgi:hypothetical protein
MDIIKQRWNMKKQQYEDCCGYDGCPQSVADFVVNKLTYGDYGDDDNKLESKLDRIIDYLGILTNKLSNTPFVFNGLLESLTDKRFRIVE